MLEASRDANKGRDPRRFDSIERPHAAKTLLRNQTLLIGDFNTGVPYQDERSSELTCSAEFSELLARGWIDLWRIRHPDSRERSYYERPWLGYRIDHALGSPAFNQRVRAIYYSHTEREAGISDHSSLHLLIGRQRRRDIPAPVISAADANINR